MESHHAKYVSDMSTADRDIKLMCKDGEKVLAAEYILRCRAPQMPIDKTLAYDSGVVKLFIDYIMSANLPSKETSTEHLVYLMQMSRQYDKRLLADHVREMLIDRAAEYIQCAQILYYCNDIQVVDAAKKTIVDTINEHCVMKMSVDKKINEHKFTCGHTLASGCACGCACGNPHTWHRTNHCNTKTCMYYNAPRMTAQSSMSAKALDIELPGVAVKILRELLN